MSPRFMVSPKQANNLNHQNMDENDNDSNNASEVDPFDDNEFSELEDDDIDEPLELEEGGKNSKRKISEVLDKDEHGVERKKKKSAVSRKPPTAEEMTRLWETEHLFHSNLFRMQIEELLLEIKPKKKSKKAVKTWLEKFVAYLMEIPENSSAYEVDDLQWLNKFKVQYPLPSLPSDSKGKFQFVKPLSVNCFGSFNSECCVGPNYSIDVVITIPKVFFQKEDYLNARYHKKRALYLCCIAEYLLSSTSLDPNSPPEFCVRSGDSLKPMLLVKPSAQWSSRIKVYIHAVPESDSFKLFRFGPTKNNVRQKWWCNGCIENEDPIPTPYYNASIGQDLVMEFNEKYFCGVINENPNLRDALLLLKVWLQQRELYENSGGVNGFLLSALVVALFKCHKLNPRMSSYQVLRNTWLALSQTDWLTSGLSLSEAKSSAISLEEFHSHYEVVFVDLTGFVNIAANVTKINYIRLKEEARLALKYLDNSSMNSFQVLFMIRMPFLQQFDHVISIKTKKVLQSWKKMNIDVNKELDLFANKERLFTSIIVGLLERGLGQRVSLIAVQLVPPITWSVIDNRPKVLWNSLVFGLKLDQEFALSVIEKGPEANLSEGAEFRNFWSSKSELRRFQDGSVCESVVWDTPDAPILRRIVITQNIVEFIFTDKLKFMKGSFTYVSNQLESLVKDKSLPDGVGGSVEELSLSIIQSLDDLVNKIREISLPLPVTSVLGTSSSVRYTDVFPPTSYDGFSKFISENGILNFNGILKNPLVSAESIEAVIQLGLSGKWPESVEAIRRIRAAFIIEIGKELSAKYNLKTQPFIDHLRVFKDGYIYKLRVVYPREISLMKEVTTSEGLTAYRDTAESLRMEKYLLHLPKLTGILHGLSQQFPGYGPTVRLVKRWIRAQMLDDELFPDIPIELIVAWQFVSPEPYTTILQPQTAFLRVLNTLSNTNWCLEPIIINFNGDLTCDDITEIEQTFRSGRENNSLPGLFIATSCDKTGIVWTRDSPTLPILYHIAKLAKATLKLLETELLLVGDLIRFKVIFRPPLDFYDVIIHIKELKNTRHAQGIDWRGADKKMSSISKFHPKHSDPIVDFNPVHNYLVELRENYGEFALFFHDSYGGDLIGVLFKPSVNEIKDFKVSHLNARKPELNGKEPQLIFNKDAVIEDFYHIGKNVVKTIEKNEAKT